MKNAPLFLSTAFIAILASYATLKMANRENHPAQIVSTNDSTKIFDRVIKSGQLNCGYVIYSPYFTKDPNTGELGGIFHDITDEVGKRLNLKINWVAESGWGTYIQDVSTGKVDALCSGLWADSAAARGVGYSTPLMFAGVEAYVRAEDTRFDNNLSAIDHPEIRIATSDGSVSGTIGLTDFPKAQIISLPNLSDYSQVIENVVTNKADVVFIETPKALEYLKANPGKIKKIPPGDPVRIYRTVYALKQDEIRLQSMLDTALNELLDSGFVEKILQKYEVQTGQIFYRVNRPYRVLGSKE